MRTGQNIYKRKDGRWEARYYKGRKDNGQIIYGSCYGKTYQEAKHKAEQAKSDIVSAAHPQRYQFPIFEVICDEWMRYNYLRLKQSTCVKYQIAIDKHIKPHLGKLPLSEVSTEAIRQFGAALLNAEGLAPKTVSDILVLLHSILKYSAKHYPGTTMTIDIPYPKKAAKEMRVLSKEEQDRLTNYLLTDLDPCKFGVLLAIWTGIRIGELCALKWDHIFIEEQMIKIDTTMQRLHNNTHNTSSKTSVVIDSPKTTSSVRIIPIGNQAAMLCKMIDPHNENAYVLTGTERYMEPRLLQYHFHRFVCRCNLKDATFHTLRHTFATRCIEVGFEIKSLSEILGHANTAITLNRYVHCSLELKRKNMNKLEVLYM